MVCPNCGVSIKRFDLAPNCKKCGVHIMYFTQEADLARDAKKTELEFAKARAFVAKLKASFILGKLPIARMVFTVLAIAALAVPYGGVTLALPYFSQDISLGAIGVYSLFSDDFLTRLLSLPKIGIAQAPLTLVLVWTALFLAAALCVVALFVAFLLSFINIKKGCKAMGIISVITIVFNAATALLPFILSSKAAQYTFIQVHNGAGAYVSIAFSAVMLAINLLMLKSEIVLPVKEVDLQRIEIYKKIKAGQAKLDDYPVPILETEEERENRLNALAGKPKAKKKNSKRNKKKKGDENDG